MCMGEIKLFFKKEGWVMNMVRLFQERLDVSRGEAIWRLIGCFSLLACFGATIFALSYVSLLYTYNFKEKIPMLHGRYTKVELLNGDVTVDKEKFTELMKKGEGKFSNEIFVCLDRERIVYMTKVEGLKYLYYEQIIPVSHYHPILFQQTQQIKDGFVEREIKSNRTGVTLVLMLTLMVLFLFLISAGVMQCKFVAREEPNMKVWI